MQSPGWGDMTVLHYLGQGLADRKEQRVRDNNRLDRGGVALDPELTAQIKAIAQSTEDAYNEMLMAEYERVVPENVRKWAATIPGLATGELFPRIIAGLGHPRIATPRRPDPDDPHRKLISEPAYIRGPHELRQYAGAGDPSRKPRKGMTQDELFAMGKVREIRPLLYIWSTSLVKMATPMKPGSRRAGEPKSLYAASSKWWKIFTSAKLEYAGHEGKCPGNDWPLPCAGTHRRHSWLVTSLGLKQPQSITCVTHEQVQEAVRHLGLPRTGQAGDPPAGAVISSVLGEHARVHSLAATDAQLPDLPRLLCQNKKVPPARPNGCGITAHREWGEVGSPWRPGHIDMAAHRKLHQKFLDQLWEVAGEDGLTPYEFRWMQDFRGFPG